jgi:hypothetical protein
MVGTAQERLCPPYLGYDGIIPPSDAAFNPRGPQRIQRQREHEGFRQSVRNRSSGGRASAQAAA